MIPPAFDGKPSSRSEKQRPMARMNRRCTPLRKARVAPKPRAADKARATMAIIDDVSASVRPGAAEVAPSRRIAAEALGSAFLLMAVVGSGIMAERLAGGITAIALLGNTVATGAALVVLISIFGPLSGAHFNPAVTLYFALGREISPALGGAYVGAQLIGALCGAWVAHLMFEVPVFEISAKLRDGPAQMFSEFV